MIFLITYRNYLEDVAVTRFDDAAIAKTHLDAKADQATSGLIIGDPLDIEGSKKYMIDLFNALAREGDEVVGPNGFNNRATGQTRIFDRLTQYYIHLPVTTAPAAGITEQPVPAVEPHTTDSESSAPEQQQEDDMAKAKKTKASKKTKTTRVKKTKVTRTPRVKGELRKGSIADEVAKIWSRDKGASHAETLAIIVGKFPDKKEAALSNTLRGCTTSIPKTTGRKLSREKQEKRGMVYFLA